MASESLFVFLWRLLPTRLLSKLKIPVSGEGLGGGLRPPHSAVLPGLPPGRLLTLVSLPVHTVLLAPVQEP